MTHTPPLNFCLLRTLIHVGHEGEPFCTLSVSGFKGMNAEERNAYRAKQIARAERMVLTWNAHASLTAQRDELLAALQDVVSAIDDDDDIGLTMAVHLARAVIARATQEAGR